MQIEQTTPGLKDQMEWRSRASLHTTLLPEVMAAFGIAGAGGRRLKHRFMMHPPPEERRAALEAASTERIK